MTDLHPTKRRSPGSGGIHKLPSGKIRAVVVIKGKKISGSAVVVGDDPMAAENAAFANLEKKLKTPLPRFVYFIQAESGPIKIGVAIDPQSRLNTLQCSHFEKLTLLFISPGGRELEQECHRIFAKCRIRGEWFRCEGNLKDLIDEQREKRRG